MIEVPAVVLDGWVDAGDGGAGEQRGQQRAGADHVGCGSGDVRSDRREREGEVGESGGRVDEIGDHGGEPGVREQVGFALAQGAGLG